MSSEQRRDETMKETRELPVKLTDEEMAAIVALHSDESSKIAKVDERKKSALAGFRHEKKPHVDEVARLQGIKDTGCELRKVECEWRDSLVNGGGQELVRLDTMEVIDRNSDDPEDNAPDSAQPALPFAAPAVPVLRWTGIDADGVAYPITAEQFDAAEREIKATGSAVVFVGENSDQRVTLKNVVRAKACEFCGMADGTHRQPECDEAKVDASETPTATAEALGHDGEPPEGFGDETDADDYDRNDTAAVAAKIAEVPPPNDRPLPSAADATTKVKPKRAKAASVSEGNGAE